MSKAKRIRWARNEDSGENERTCDRCEREILLDEQFCKYCRKPNQKFNLEMFNEGAPALMGKVYENAEHARSICKDIGEDAIHQMIQEHSDKMFKDHPEIDRIRFCDDCGMQIVKDN